MPLVVTGRKSVEHGRVGALIDELGLTGVRRRFPTEVSLGEQQRTAIARALVTEPQLVVLDEPTAHQDRRGRDRILAVFRTASAAGTAFLVASHDPVVETVADRHLTILDGVLAPAARSPWMRSLATVRISPARYRVITAIALGLLIDHRRHRGRGAADGVGARVRRLAGCNDERFVDVSSNHTAIEQVNRLFTGLVAAAVIAAVLGSLWRVPRRRDLTWLSLGLVAGVVGQVILGGITVLVDLHPLAVQGHMLLSLVLVATSVVLLRRAGEPDGRPRRVAVSGGSRVLVWALATATAAAIVAGTVVTGAGPHAGDEDVQRFDVDIAAAARVHGTTVTIAVAIAVALALLVRRSPAIATSCRDRCRRGSSSPRCRRPSGTCSTSTRCHRSWSGSTSPGRPRCGR